MLEYKKEEREFMMRAKDFLTESVTCVIKKENTILTSEKKGIAPMMRWIEEGLDLSGAEVADRVVGKAAAMLFVKAGIREVYAQIISIPGKEYLEDHGVDLTFDTLTDRIINRKGDGLCPMESTVMDMNDIEKAYLALKAKQAELITRSLT